MHEKVKQFYFTIQGMYFGAPERLEYSLLLVSIDSIKNTILKIILKLWNDYLCIFSAMVAGKNITSVSEQNGYILLHASLSNKHKINTAVVLDSLLLRNDPIIC